MRLSAHSAALATTINGVIFLLLLGVSMRLSAQHIRYPEYNMDSVYQVLLKDTVNNTGGAKSWLKHYADSIRSYGNDVNSFFPYKPFNKVVVYRQNEAYLLTGNKGSLSPYSDTSKSYVLDSEDINELLEIINNPLYFTFAECGTAITQYEIRFMNGSGIVEKLKIACSDRQIISDSEVKDMNWQRMKYGAITDQKATERLRQILVNAGAFFTARY